MSPPRPSRIRTRLAHTLAVVAAAALAGSACGGGEGRSWAGEGKHAGKRGREGKRGRGGKPGGREGKWGQPEQVLTVQTTAVEPARIERRYRTSGTLKALQSADLVAVQSGIIIALGAEEGDQVEAGQVLARLDSRGLRLEASRADLQVRNLEQELGRLEQVAARNAVSREELDKQRYAVQEARATAKLSRHQAKQTLIRAPFTGTITKRHVDVGNLATTATPVVSIADLSAIELELHLPERESTHVKLDSSVEVELLDGAKFAATVVRRAPVVDAMTGTVKFTVRSDNVPPGAVPGAFARARVLVDSRDAAPSLPASAVFWVEGTPNVYVLREGKARRTEVELGLEGEERVEVVGGLEPDAVIVEDSSSGITEGMALKAASAGGGGSVGAEQHSGS